jgi:DNA-directed RNA polymerase subunit RPC12/RpoP
MTTTFQCPSCGSPQDVPQDGSTSIECRYCGHTIIIPEELREQPEPAVQTPEPLSQPVVIDLRPIVQDQVAAAEVSRRRRRNVTCLVLSLFLLPLIFVGIGFLPAILTARPAINAVKELLAPTESPTPYFELDISATIDAIIPTFIPEDILSPEPSPTPGFASLEFTLGEEGRGPGQFMDARNVSVDSLGRIYVAEYLGGRVQVFDASGNFLTQWLVDDQMPVLSLAVTRDGNAYLVQNGRLTLHDGESGKLIQEIDSGQGDAFYDAYATLDGGVATTFLELNNNFLLQDDILRYDRDGNLAMSVEGAVAQQTGEPELSPSIAEDTLGNIYVLAYFNNAVFKYAADGRYISRFGSEGSEPGQFRFTDDIAVDNQGRVYVSDSNGIQVFDPDGRYLDRIEVEGPAFGLAFDSQDNLYVAARDRIYKYTLNQ